jgi:phage shock protein PspC (stress-responsive transcriptional regulator)
MKQVININFHGRVVPIEVTAFDTLKAYTDSLRRYFANEEGRDEIINDIESRIAELFEQRLKSGATCITDSDVEAIIKSIGRPEDFEEAEGGNMGESTTHNGSSSQSTGTGQQGTSSGTGSKRLYRDEHNKVLGGVCAGIANYFNLDPVITRIIFVILVFAGGLGILPYLIMWVAVPSSASAEIGGSRKKFFRDPDDKIIAGVCSGIGHYFGINPWIPRVLFLLPFVSILFTWNHWGFYDFPSFLRFSFSPASTIVYIILWLAVPEAITTTEKLEMKGEKVDMNSIKNSVMEEMKGLSQRAEKLGSELKNTVEEKSKTVASDVNRMARRTGTSFGDIIALFIKGLGYLITAFVCFIVVIGLFSLGIGAIGLFPLKDFILRDGWQNVFAWGTLLFFIAIPIIGIITWVIRRIARIKSNSKMVRWSFLSMWVIGIICFGGLLISLAKDFRYPSKERDNLQEIVLSNPTVNKLELTTNIPFERSYQNRWFRMEPFEGFLDGDTAYVRNVSVLILPSRTDSFNVVVTKTAHGSTREAAIAAASKIPFNVTQLDSILLLERGIAINTTDKFRNQHVTITVYVPIGKKIKVNRNVGWNREVWFHGPFGDSRYWDDNDENIYYNQRWEFNIEYTMTEKGLRSNSGQYVNERKNGRRRTVTTYEYSDNNNSYRYSDTTTDKPTRVDSLKEKAKVEAERYKDSLEKVREKIDRQLEKINKEENNSPVPTASNGAVLFSPLSALF